MNKSELISALATREGVTERQATDIVNMIFDGFTSSLSTEERIELRGFGSFSVRSYKTYMGRNPKTGLQVRIEPKRLPFFKVGKGLNKKINSGI